MTRSAGIALVAAALLLGCARAQEQPRGGAPSSGEARERLEWGLLFYLPYDNELDGIAERVEGQLVAAGAPAGIGMAVQTDRIDLGGQRRLVVRSDGARRGAVDEEDGADVATLEAFLRWATRELPARRYALMLLGHGGRLDHVGVDWHPSAGPSSEPGWMRLTAAAETIRGWAGGLEEGRLELLFLQQCGRASVEDLYTVRDTAPYVLASETVVGAPNTYYGPILRRLATDPDMDGRALGRAIMDADDHTASAVLLRGATLAEIPARVDAVADALLAGRTRPLRRPRAQSASLTYAGESTYDLCSYARVLHQLGGGGPSAALDTALEGLTDDLVIAHRRRSFPLKAHNPSWCGLSFYVPTTPERLERYADLPLYRDSRWSRLARAIAPPPVTLGAPTIEQRAVRGAD